MTDETSPVLRRPREPAASAPVPHATLPEIGVIASPCRGRCPRVHRRGRANQPDDMGLGGH